MLGFTNLDFPLKFEGPRLSQAVDVVDDWLRQIEIKMESWEITSDKDKLAVCSRNLTGPVNEEAGAIHWRCYDDFKRWLRRTVDIMDNSLDIEHQLGATVQSRSFRDFEKKFSAIRQLNKKSIYPLSEQTIISIFLRNIRSMDLRRMLQKQIFTNYDTLVVFAEDMIRKGRIKERYPSYYPPRSEPPSSISSARGISNGSSVSGGHSSITNGTNGSGRTSGNGSFSTTTSTVVKSNQSEARPGLFSTTTNPSTSTEVSIRRERMFPESDVPEPAEKNGEGWRTRMSFALVDHPLDLENEVFKSERDAVKSWLAEMEQVLSELDFRNHKEEVSFCIFNARGVMVKAAAQHGEFSSFAHFRKWAQTLYGLAYQKRDVVRNLMTTVQTTSLRKYIFQFRKLLGENKLCEYPVSPDLVGEFFVDNLRDEVLQSRLEQVKSRDLKRLTELCEKLLEAGEIPDNFQDWERAMQPLQKPEPKLTVEAELQSALTAQAKRAREDLFFYRQPRNVRVKAEPSPRPMELSDGAIELFAGRLQAQARGSPS